MKRPEEKAHAIYNFYCGGERIYTCFKYDVSGFPFWLNWAKKRVGTTTTIYNQKYLVERVTPAPKLSKKINIYLKKVE